MKYTFFIEIKNVLADIDGLLKDLHDGNYVNVIRYSSDVNIAIKEIPDFFELLQPTQYAKMLIQFLDIYQPVILLNVDTGDKNVLLKWIDWLEKHFHSGLTINPVIPPETIDKYADMCNVLITSSDVDIKMWKKNNAPVIKVKSGNELIKQLKKYI